MIKFNRFALRSSIPALLLASFFSITLFLFVSQITSSFLSDQIERHAESLCFDLSLLLNSWDNSQSTSFVSDETVWMENKKTETLNLLHTFFEQHHLEGIVYASPEMSILLRTKQEIDLDEILTNLQKGVRGRSFIFRNHEYKMYSTDVTSWRWKVIFFVDTQEYQAFFGTIRQICLWFGILLLIASFLFSLYLNRMVSFPIFHIVQALGKGIFPEYKGIKEFELLSDHVRRIIEFLQKFAQQMKLGRNTTNSNLWGAVFEHSLEGIMITDSAGDILRVNSAFTEVTGYTAVDCIGKNPRMLQSGIYDKAFYEKMWHSLKEKGQWENEIWNRRKNGEAYLQWLCINAINNEHGETTNYVGVFHDITAIKHHQQQIQHQAYHDALTGLPNRQLFRDHLEMALAHAQRNKLEVGVMILDLDNFKNINDSLGHHVGDLLLQEIATRLKQCCRSTDTVARFSGDEFMIILPELKKDGRDIVEVAQRIIHSLSEPFSIKDSEIICTVSIGITIYPDDGADVSTLMKNADLAMYRAKEKGRDTYVLYTKAMYDLVVERLDLEMSLRKALRNGEFRVYYQPQVNLKTGKISGTEALIRWKRSEHELISPSKFIPLAEDTGIILPLGEWVLRTACKQTKAWHDLGFDWLTISVNLSAKQFQDERLIQLVQDVLNDTRLAPEFLCLEITENTVMKDVDTAIKIMAAIECLGVHLSIDDFGTGYSSLSYLKSFPLDEIKIDKSFVRDIPRDQDDIEIAKAILSLARSLKLKVLAEGVETPTQLEFMRVNSCDEIQGFLFSRPVQPEELKIFLKEGKRLYNEEHVGMIL